jgi:hypothetical protein
MNNIIYIVGLVVVVIAVLTFFGCVESTLSLPVPSLQLGPDGFE